jgi:hypothetical protein
VALSWDRIPDIKARRRSLARWKRSISEVCWVVAYAVPLQDTPILAGEPMFPMMQLLIPDVVTDLTVVERCDAECPVSMLPAKVSPMPKGIVNPLRRGRLDTRYQLSQSEGAGRIHIKMDVIPCPSSA